MTLNHKLLITVVKRGKSRHVIEAAKEKGADGATIVYGNGFGVNERRKFFGLDITNEKDVIFMAVDGELEPGVTKAVIDSGKLMKSGEGIGFNIHLAQLLGVPHLSKRPRDPNTSKGDDKVHGFQLIVTIVNQGDSDKVIDAASKAGAEGGTVLSGRGTGVNEKQKFMNFTIDPQKDMVLTLVPESHAEAVVQSIENAVDLNAPGKGIAFLIDVENVFGVNHSSFD